MLSKRFRIVHALCTLLTSFAVVAVPWFLNYRWWNHLDTGRFTCPSATTCYEVYRLMTPTDRLAGFLAAALIGLVIMAVLSTWIYRDAQHEARRVAKYQKEADEARARLATLNAEADRVVAKYEYAEGQ